MEELYNKTSLRCSKLITKSYSTSFSLGIKVLAKQYRMPVYAIYGFVRFADEIVDTFHQHDKKALLERFKQDTYKAIEEKISFNPVLHSFQMVVNKYHIEKPLIEAFLKSMEMDLDKQYYDQSGYEEYIYGSAEVVGLMCLRVFCEGNELEYQKLKPSACSLGAAFQKVNFLRDIKSDFKERKRVYFPKVNFDAFTPTQKEEIEKSIHEDFKAAYEGIKLLPHGARLGVYLAYTYYKKLLEKIQAIPSSKIQEERIRISDNHKLALLFQSYLKHSFNAI
ncbi:MAG: phytoene/squalene synthase family protein [Cytophagales bacterium]|nr:MAG: phytoene/squalene synthase family protein [Cytophagales bacterium]